jgi:putative ABC transport system permease protein
MMGLLNDFRIAFRALRRRPGFAAIAVVTLALGIGANTAIFSLIDALILRPLPFPAFGRLEIIQGLNRNTGGLEQPASFDEFRDWSRESRSFRRLAAVSPRWKFTLSGGAESEEIGGQFVSGGFFDLLGVPPAAGRAFTAAEHESAAPVVIISDGLWRRRFGADPGAIGHILMLDGEPVTIVGVARPRFEFLEQAEVWVPLERNPFSRSRRYVRMLSVVGRLRDGISPQAAAAELDAIAVRLAQRFPDSNAGIGVRMVPLREALAGKVRPALLTLLGAVALVLLIACANVASLVLARAVERRREIAIRAALGASRSRRMRLVLAECLLLSFAGAVGGLLLASVALPLLLSVNPLPFPSYAAPRLNASVFAFDAAVALATGILFGAIGGGGESPQNAQHGDGRIGTATRGARRLRGVLVAGEIALALVLLAGAGLLLRSVGRLLSVDPGFSPRSAVAFQIALPNARYRDPVRRAAFARQLESRVAALPHVTAVGRVTRLPLMSSAKNITTFLTVEGRPTPPEQRPEIDFRRASTTYFAAMKIPLLKGRLMTEEDIANGNPSVVVNETFARRFLPREDPIGKRISTATSTGEGDWQTVVGVVGDVHHLGLDSSPRPEVYYHVDTSPPSGPVYVVRADADPLALIPAIRAAVAALDPDIPVSDVATLDDLVSESISPRRVALSLLGALALLAAALAGVGVYGVVSFTTSQRNREIAIRVALGATRPSIIRMVVAQGGRPVAAGIAFGLAAAAAATRLLSGLLFAVRPIDPLTYFAATIALAAIGALAVFIPARRASTADPIAALRNE